MPPARALSILVRMGDTVLYWGPILPVGLLILAVCWMFSGRSRTLDGGVVGTLAARTPGVGRVLADFRAANFAQLLGLLIEHQVPLAEGVRLAGEASGNRVFRETAGEFARRLDAGDGARGGPDPTTASRRLPFPPLLAWLVSAGHRQETLASALQHAAITYRKRAENQAAALRSALPTLLMVAIGTTSVLLYGLVLFMPVLALWNELAIPPR